MLGLVAAIVGGLLGAFRPRALIVAENLALRQQIAVLLRKTKRPRLLPIDRAFWILLSRIWTKWKDGLAIVKPETVIAWHRRGFARFWTWKSRRHGRPPISAEIIALIVRIAAENPRWGRRRIANEIAKLGYRVDKDTVAKYIAKPVGRPRRPPSQTWGTFLRNHLVGTLAIDFFTVPTVKFDVLYVFVVLSLERRRVLHVNVTAHPFAEWAAQQIVEALGFDDHQRLIRDRDGIYGVAFDRRVNNLGIVQLRTAPRSPWQNGFVERLVGTLRRELVDHLIVLNERHLLRCLDEYLGYYNADRPHMSLDGDAPARRAAEPPHLGTVVARPRVGGLHHRYTRLAA